MTRRLLLAAFSCWVCCAVRIKKKPSSSLFQTYAIPYPYAYYGPPLSQYSMMAPPQQPQFYGPPPQGFPEQPLFQYSPPMYMQPPPQQMYIPYGPSPSQQQVFSNGQQESLPVTSPAPAPQKIPIENVPIKNIPLRSFFMPVRSPQEEFTTTTTTTANPMSAALDKALAEANKEIDKANHQANEFANFNDLELNQPVSSPFGGGSVSLSDASVPIDNHILNWRELVGLPSNPLVDGNKLNSNEVRKPLLPLV